MNPHPAKSIMANLAPRRWLGLWVVFGALAPTALLAAPTPAEDQGTLPDFGAMPLEDLLEMDFASAIPSDSAFVSGAYSDQSVSAASTRTFELRESPGIVTVITEEEIRASGARDLIDLLQLIPGFSFQSDVWGVVGLSVRGLWAQEGKVLLLVDGQEMQELTYNTLQFGNHLPVHTMQRIEIIRGPGSSLYGGNAELAVINIIMKRPQDVNGVKATASYGQFDSFKAPDYYHRSLDLSVGKRLDDFSFVVHGAWIQGNRSDHSLTDFYGDSYRLVPNSRTQNLFLDAGVSYQDLSARLIYDRYHTWQRDAYGINLPFPVETSFDSVLAEVRYDWYLEPKLRLVPKLNLKIQWPWRTDSAEALAIQAQDDYAGLYESVRAERYTAGLLLFYDVLENLSLSAGSRFTYDREVALIDLSRFNDGSDEVHYWNFEALAEGSLRTSPVNIVAGGRLEVHSVAGLSLVPRLSLTKAFEHLHYKLLLSRAFRAPGIANIDYFNPKYSGGDHIRPETSTVLEIEGGYQFSKHLLLNANLYYIRVADPIVYFYDDDDAYDNFGAIATWGLEAELRYKGDWSYLYLSYSYYRTAENSVDMYRVPLPDDDAAAPGLRHGVTLGIPQHKAAAHLIVNVWKKLFASTSWVFTSKSYAYDHADTNGNPLIGVMDPTLQVNLNLSYQDLFVKGLRVGLGVFNLFDERIAYPQAYNGGHAPLPGPSREILLTLGFDEKL